MNYAAIIVSLFSSPPGRSLLTGDSARLSQLNDHFIRKVIAVDGGTRPPDGLALARAAKTRPEAAFHLGQSPDSADRAHGR